MPCIVEDYGESERETKKKLDAATRTACEAIKALQDNGIAICTAISVDSAAWWAQHVMEDDKRRTIEKQQAEQERHRREGLAKLTPEQRRALGV